ncbi:flavonol 3-O-glucosyltransferase UGT89B1 [Gastrolobium bilobum]|uniref:flavonol 3-O-glucosyltransferase UGT89B1 n=1 Tax=Gastrolobium bilobum TaxID=150636 RepID=UPI002AAF2958|nr:flavonol 3-O-glucosyltransferase UGT89B1 [Gastrolobium bilobum]
MTVQGGNSNAPPHVLVIPFPAQGHMIPLLDLTHKLATNGSNLTITVVTTPKNQTLLTHLLSSHPSIHPLIFPFPFHPSIPPGIENAKDMPHSIRPIMFSLSKLHDPLLQWFKSHPSPPQYIISDMFCGWTQNLASELGIRRLVFSPSGAFALSTMYFLWKELPKRTNDNENDIVSFHKLPNSPTYPWWQVSPLFRSYVAGDPDSECFRDWFLGNIASWGLVVNSFSELENRYLEYLKMELGHDRVWAVGPLLPADDLSTTQRGGSSSVSVNNVVSWLDQRGDRKVVYVCFGSQMILTNDQTVAIASGLAKSGVHFIWSIKTKNENQEGIIPAGFEDETAGRGLVIRGWAPQVLILRHRAVGAFLTHCGWNSVLESVVAGVSMLAWPMSADQFVDATLLVEELKVAKKVCEGEKTVPDSDQLGRVLAESVSESAVETRQALKLQAAALDAIREGGGSSEKDLRCLIEQLHYLV